MSARMTAIGAIPTLPIFFKLKERVVVIAGGSPPAVWKAELLAAASACVMVYDPDPSREMVELQQRLGDRLHLTLRHWTADDLDGAALGIGALQGVAAEEFRHASREAGVPVNIIDVPDLCDFQFGTIVDRAPLLIAISTDGAAPVFGQTLRARIEALLPSGITAWATAAKDWRSGLQTRALSFAARRRFWELFADRALDGTDRLPTEEDRQACLTAALQTDLHQSGSLDLVGLGPGDIDLLTLQAIRILQSADVIIHERVLSSGLIGLARREAHRLPEDADDAITITMITEWIKAGKQVVWAGLGDPTACTRWRNRRAALSLEPRIIVKGIRCTTCPNGCAMLDQ